MALHVWRRREKVDSEVAQCGQRECRLDPDNPDSNMSRLFDFSSDSMVPKQIKGLNSTFSNPIFLSRKRGVG